MNDYISRDDVRSMILNYRSDNPKKQTVWAMVISDMLRDLKEIPDADVQPVKRAKWEEERYDDLLGCYIATCSECGYESTDRYRITDNHKCCEYCGARMKED